MFLVRSKGARVYSYAMEHTDAALQVLDDYLTVSGTDPDDVQAARLQLQDTGTYRGPGGLWQLGAVRDQDDMNRWYELHESHARTDPHYANRVEAERIRNERFMLETLQRMADSEPDDLALDDEMMQALIDAYHNAMVHVPGIDNARADLVTARETVRRAAGGHDDADLPAAAARLDHALRALCPHDPQGWYTAPDRDGHMLTTCNTCGVSWYEHE